MEGRHALFTLGGIWLVLSMFFVVPWAAGQVYGTFDLSHITIAIEDLYKRYQSAGDIPVWTPEFQGGFPMMANGFQSFWYIPHMVLRAVLPGVWVANISLLLHMWLAATGMWLLVRRDTKDIWSAGAASLLYAGGGYFIGHITLPHLYFPAAWLPLILWLAIRFWDNPRWQRAVALAAAIGAHIFAGHIQMFFYTAVVLLVTAVILIVDWRVRAQPGHRFDRRWLWALLVPVVVWVLAAVHILPIQELLPLSKRGQALTPEEAYSISYPLWQTLTWFQADVFGSGTQYVGAKNEPELLLFFGVVGVVMGGCGVVAALRERRLLGFIATILVIGGLVIGGGEFSPLYRFLHSLPTPLAGLANPGRAMVLVHLGWSVLAGYGVYAFIRSSRRRAVVSMGIGILVMLGIGWLIWQRVPAIPVAMAGEAIRWGWLVIVGLLMLGTSFVPRWGRGMCVVAIMVIEIMWGGWEVNPRVPAVSLTVAPRVASLHVGNGASPRIFSHVTFEPTALPNFGISTGPRLDTVRSVRQTIVPQRNDWSGIKVGVTWNSNKRQPAVVTVNVLDAAGKIVREAGLDGNALRSDELIEIRWPAIVDSREKTYTLVISSTARGAPQPYLVMYANNEADFNPTGELFECVRTTCKPLHVPEAAVAADAVLTLIYDDQPTAPAREALVPLFGESAGYRMIRGHMQLQLLNVHRYLALLGEGADFTAADVLNHRTLLDRFATGWLVALFPEHRSLTVTDLPLFGTVPVGDSYAHAYRNTAAWPRIHLASRIQYASSVDEAREKLAKNEVGDDEVVVVGEQLPGDIGRAEAQWTLDRDQARDMALTVTSESPQLVVVRDIIFPGWKATINGKSVPIRPVDSLFRGVVVPPGSNEVRLSYQPRPYRLGAILSASGWLVIVFIGLYEARRRLA